MLYIADEVFFRRHCGRGDADSLGGPREDRRGRRGPITEGESSSGFSRSSGAEVEDTHGWLQYVHEPATSGVAKHR
jgi:hypothetical protein